MTEHALVYCKHMDADVYEGSCAMCSPPPEPDPVPHGAQTRALFSSRCPACDERIDQGEVIERSEHGWIHAECAEPEAL